MEDITQVVTRNRLRVRRNLERDRQQSVARQDRDRVSENFVTGRTTAAQIIVVHAGQIIVNERIGVDAFNRAGGG